MVLIIIAGILTAIVVPQFADHTSEARLATLDADLTAVRNSIELYYHQHNAVYPGAVDSSDPAQPSASHEEDFLRQLTLYTDISGRTSPTGDPRTFRFGPYLRKLELPANPFTGTATLVADLTTASQSTSASDGTSAWKFVVKTGRFIANDDAAHATR